MDEDPIKSEMALRAKRGAALLDEEYPGWEVMIDLRKLDLHGECECVLGQIAKTMFGDGWGVAFTEMRSLLTGDVDANTQKEWSDAYGFTVFDSLPCSEQEKWALLTNAWRDEIVARRNEIAGLVT